MNWFERHLNWTAAITLVSGLVFTFIFSLLSTAFYGFSTWNEVSRPEIYRHIVILLCSILVLIGFGWILLRKKQSPFYLLFFLPLLATWIFSMLQLYHRDFTVLMMVIIPVALVINGFIFLLLLKNNSLGEICEDTSSSGISTYFSLRWFRRQSASRKVVLMGIQVLLLCITGFSGYSYYSMDNIYNTHTLTLSGDETACIFECPISYEESLFPDFRWIDAEKIPMERTRWFRRESVIDVHIWGKSSFESYSEMNRWERTKTIISNTLSNLLFHSNLSITDLKMRYESMHGYPAVRATAVIPETQDEPDIWGTVEIVWFERRSNIWVISILYPESREYRPSKHFEHLLDSFEIEEKPLLLDLFVPV